MEARCGRHNAAGRRASGGAPISRRALRHLRKTMSRHHYAANLATNGKRLRAVQADGIRKIPDLEAGPLDEPGLASRIRADIGWSAGSASGPAEHHDDRSTDISHGDSGGWYRRSKTRPGHCEDGRQGHRRDSAGTNRCVEAWLHVASRTHCRWPKRLGQMAKRVGWQGEPCRKIRRSSQGHKGRGYQYRCRSDYLRRGARHSIP